MPKGTSRREFLKGLATIAAGMAISGCEPVVVTVEKEVVNTVEVEKVVEVEKEVVQTVEVEKVITATPEPAPVEVKTVKFMIWGGAAEKEAWQARENLFAEKYPNIKIAILYPPGNYQEKLTAMLASGTAPDCFVPGSMRTAVPQGILLPLDAYVEADEAWDADDFLPGTLERGQYQGVQYCIPGGIGPQVVFWNVDYFDDAGLENPNELHAAGEWTPEKFLEYAHALTMQEGDQFTVFGFMFYWPEYVLWLHHMGVPMFNEDYTKCLFDDSTREAIQWTADLINVEHVSPLPAEVGEFGSWPGFRDGKYGMFISGPWQQARLADSEYNWDIAWPPETSDGGPAMSAGRGGMAVYSLSQVPFEAYRWASFTESKESQAVWAGLGFDLPSRQSLIPEYESGELFTNPDAVPPSVDIWYEVARAATPQWTGGWLVPQTESLLGSAWGQVKSDEATAEEAFNEGLIADIDASLAGV
jgi:multiple sugar transport system substrate-binding protein